MKKPSSKIRDEIARLQEQLRLAETREAERIGRIALRAGLGEVAIDETELLLSFESITKRFRSDQGGDGRSSAQLGSSAGNQGRRSPDPADQTGTPAGMPAQG